MPNLRRACPELCRRVRASRLLPHRKRETHRPRRMCGFRDLERGYLPVPLKFTTCGLFRGVVLEVSCRSPRTRGSRRERNVDAQLTCAARDCRRKYWFAQVTSHRDSTDRHRRPAAVGHGQSTGRTRGATFCLPKFNFLGEIENAARRAVAVGGRMQSESQSRSRSGGSRGRRIGRRRRRSRCGSRGRVADASLLRSPLAWRSLSRGGRRIGRSGCSGSRFRRSGSCGWRIGRVAVGRRRIGWVAVAVAVESELASVRCNGLSSAGLRTR